MASDDLSDDLSATFRKRLEHALASDEIARPAQELKIPSERLVALVSEQRALEFAEVSHRAWRRARDDLFVANHRFATARNEVLRPRLPVRVAIAVRTRLPGGAAFAERLARTRDARIDALRRDFHVEARAAEEDAAATETLEILDELAILAPLRAYIGERSDRAWSTQLHLSAANAPGLAELRASPSVPLAGIDEVDARMRAMPAGSIGIAGPRGVGKTTLIRWFTSTQASPARFGAYVSAPTRYDARDFLLHLFATLCSAVIGETSETRARPQTGVGKPWQRVAMVLRWPLNVGIGALIASAGLVAASLLGLHVDPRLLVGLACLGGAADAALGTAVVRSTIGLDSDEAAWPTPPVSTLLAMLAFGLLVVGSSLIALSQLAETTPIWAWGTLGVACSLMVVWIGSPRIRIRMDASDVEPDMRVFALRREARQRLRDLHFQMTVSKGWGGALKLPLLEGTLSGEQSLASRPRSLPELVDELERFIRAAVEIGRVVIGIDELDKMETEQDAHRFLNEIKGVFGIRGCFFLVSVSEEAMSGFARRDARLRDAFDSAFDEIVYIRPLDLAQSRTLLSERVIGLPTQFGALCHVLAGGLPRDLIRAARTVLARNEVGLQISLAEVVRGVVARELDARARGASIALRSFGPHATRFVDWLADVEGAVDRLDEICTSTDVWERTAAVDDPTERARLAALILELQGFCHFALTLRDVFGDAFEQDAFEALQAGGGPLDLLARAQTTFSVNALLAWSEVSAFRKANRLPVLAPPTLDAAPGGRPRRGTTDGVASSA